MSQSFLAEPPELVGATARAILQELRPGLQWEIAKPEAQALCLRAARAAIAVVRFNDLLEGTHPRVQPPQGGG
ncbi:hypothetical protein [Siccirubricoccus phaeus]|uniref:hypothetical protein n=1 Tax=Siccirubricoccus phaeus TaxID=2595053 RepID=UPI0011F1CDEE|nr:hypothetical protein [Siccirubricoccus phaeus]